MNKYNKWDNVYGTEKWDFDLGDRPDNAFIAKILPDNQYLIHTSDNRNLTVNENEIEVYKTASYSKGEFTVTALKKVFRNLFYGKKKEKKDKHSNI